MIKTVLTWHTLSEDRPLPFRDVFIETRKYKVVGIGYYNSANEKWCLCIGKAEYEELPDSAIVMWAEIPRVR